MCKSQRTSPRVLIGKNSQPMELGNAVYKPRRTVEVSIVPSPQPAGWFYRGQSSRHANGGRPSTRDSPAALSRLGMIQNLAACAVGRTGRLNEPADDEAELKLLAMWVPTYGEHPNETFFVLRNSWELLTRGYL